MTQDIIVGIIVLAAASYLSLRMWRTLRGKKTGCGCDSCPAIKSPKTPPEKSGSPVG